MRLIDNFLAKNLYKCKFYIDVARGRIGWVTGWLPEIVSVGVILHFFGVDFTRKQVLFGVPVLLLVLFFIGLFYHRVGLYQLEVTTNTKKDPVQSEIYFAALKINGKVK